MSNEVKLTFAGDSAKLEQAFDRVGGAARKMGDDVGKAASGFDRASEASDTAEGRFQGFSSTLTGTRDIMEGFGSVAKGDVFLGLVTVGGGAADLAEGFNYTLIPAMASAVGWLKGTKVATLATAAAQHVAAAGSKMWAAAQWLLNVALLANPIVLIIAGIVLLVGAIVLIATKTTWFQTIWRVAWTHVKAWALAFWDWIKGLPGMLAGAFANLANIITAPWRFAFNQIAKLWNSTVGKLSFRLPDWVPTIGGKGFDMPKIPTLHSGGVVPGPPGAEVLAVLQAGERVVPAGASGGSGVHVSFTGGGSLDRLLAEFIHKAVRTGQIQLVVNGQRVGVA